MDIPVVSDALNMMAADRLLGLRTLIRSKGGCRSSAAPRYAAISARKNVRRHRTHTDVLYACQVVPTQQMYSTGPDILTSTVLQSYLCESDETAPYDTQTTRYFRGANLLHTMLSLCISSNDSVSVCHMDTLQRGSSVEKPWSPQRPKYERRRASYHVEVKARRLGRFSSRVPHRVVPDRDKVPDRCNAWGQPWTSAVTLPQGRSGLSVRRLEVCCIRFASPLCRQVHREFMRSAVASI